MTEGREIKKTGYMYGTPMYRARNVFVVVALSFTVLSGFAATKFLFNAEKFRIGQERYQQTLETWDKEQAQRRLEALEKRHKQIMILTKNSSNNNHAIDN